MQRLQLKLLKSRTNEMMLRAREREKASLLIICRRLSVEFVFSRVCVWLVSGCCCWSAETEKKRENF